MKKVILLVSLLFLCTSCFFIKTGYWVNGGCRPKNPNFKILKTPFKETDKLVFNKIYTQNGVYKSGIGFYKDGKLFLITNYNYEIQNYDSLTFDFVKSKNWDNAINIGYWRVEDNKIKIEFFICKEGGYYLKKKGEIKGDTIFFERGCGSNPFKREICWDKYILSDFSFEK